MFQIEKRIIVSSSGLDCPLLTSDCEVTVGVNEDDNVILSLISFPVNLKHNWCIGNVLGYYSGIVDECLLGMKTGEKSEFTFSSNDSGRPDRFTFTLELHSFTGGKYLFAISVPERLDLAERWKVAGNSFFTANDICMAGFWYSKALKSLLSCLCEDMDEGGQTKFRLLQCQCRVNLAAVQLKRNLFKHAKENCSLALEIDHNQIKALFRRAQANLELGLVNNALRDLKQALKIQPNSFSVRTLLTKVKEAQKKEQPESVPVH